jgi:type III restriction enzyme
VALKMATGTGKTVVMAMLIAWHALNKARNPQDKRFGDAFLVVTPGITIRDRLRVLQPNDSENYYRARDLVPDALREQLGRARIVITNYHAFLPRERGDAARLTKNLLGAERTGAFTESPDQMVRRVCRELGTRSVVVLNDEAHHCYRRRPDVADLKLSNEEKKEEREARVWLSGLESVKRKLGIRALYDLSATPFFLRGSGYSEGTLFPWVVSDFSLIDAIEAGLVKVPRVPVEDNADPTRPTYRDLWSRIRDELPRRGRRDEAELTGERGLPVELEGALQSLYANYARSFERWQNSDAAGRGGTPPVFIVVCSTTAVSKLVFDYIAGYDKPLPDGSTVAVPGRLPLFSNVADTRWLPRPVTILVDSTQLESEGAMSKEFKAIAAREIDEFKTEYRLRSPGADVEQLTDEDLLREVMNTVGKPGKLGERIRCVVSVSMLTEGWDANTVTHVLGVRAFGTQLLCEQVVGRGLRRVSYAPNDQGLFAPEYAEVYGVPFSFIPSAGSSADPKPGPPVTRVRALESRAHLAISFPHVLGYRWEVGTERLAADFGDAARLTLSTRDVPTRVTVEPIVGAGEVHTLDDLKTRREGEIAFAIARVLLERYFRDDAGAPRVWLFPQLVGFSRRWLAECLTLQDGTFPGLLVFARLADRAAGLIHAAIVRGSDDAPRLIARLRPYDPVGSTAGVDFDTIKPAWPTRADRCHISHVVADTGSWEQKVAQSLEEMDEVAAYVKNERVGFSIPYVLDGDARQYFPDFLVRWDDGHGPADLLTVIVEVSGERKPDKAVKVATARDYWLPAVNGDGGFGRWAFVELHDPWNTQTILRAALAEAATRAPAAAAAGV